MLRDFETLLDFVGERAIKVSGIHQILPMNALGKLNGRLSKPLRLGLKRPQQKFYPHINGLYLLPARERVVSNYGINMSTVWCSRTK